MPRRRCLSPSTQNSETGSAGDTVNYNATFTDTGTVAYYIDGASFTSLDPNAGLLTPFFNGDPINGDPITGDFEVLPGQPDLVPGVFSLTLDPATPPGTILGTVTFTGQSAAQFLAGTGTDSALGSQDLTLQVNPASTSAVPEPSAFALLGLGLLPLGLTAVRRSRAA